MKWIDLSKWKVIHSSQYRECPPPNCFIEVSDDWYDFERKQLADFFLKMFVDQVEEYGGLILLPPDCEVFSSAPTE